MGEYPCFLRRNKDFPPPARAGAGRRLWNLAAHSVLVPALVFGFCFDFRAVGCPEFLPLSVYLSALCSAGLPWDL